MNTTEEPETINFTLSPTEIATAGDDYYDYTADTDYWLTGHYVTVTVILGIACVGGLVGNALMAAVALRKSNRGQPDMWILLNLFLVNILFSAVVLPMQIADYYAGAEFWAFHRNRALCKFVPYALNVIIYVICYTLGLHSAMLFIASHFRKSAYHRITRTVVLLALVAVWIVSLLFCIPVAVSVDIQVLYHNLSACVYSDFPSVYRNAILRLVFLLLLPFVTITVVTGWALWRIGRASTRQVAYEGLSESDLPGRRRTAILLLVLLLLFLVCWFPLDVIHLALFHNWWAHRALTKILKVSQVLSVLNPCVVPFVFIALDPRVSTEIRAICACMRRRNQAEEDARNV